MSQANVERIRAALDRFLAGTSESAREEMLNVVAEAWHPEIELDASETPVPDIEAVYRGRDAVKQFWREWLAAWETMRFDYELVDAGDHVVMLFDPRMRGRSTGIDVAFGKVAWVFTYKGGLLVHQTLYMDQAEALGAVGLSE